MRHLLAVAAQYILLAFALQQQKDIYRKSLGVLRKVRIGYVFKVAMQHCLFVCCMSACMPVCVESYVTVCMCVCLFAWAYVVHVRAWVRRPCVCLYCAALAPSLSARGLPDHTHTQYRRHSTGSVETGLVSTRRPLAVAPACFGSSYIHTCILAYALFHLWSSGTRMPCRLGMSFALLPAHGAHVCVCVCVCVVRRFVLDAQSLRSATGAEGQLSVAAAAPSLPTNASPRTLLSPHVLTIPLQVRLCVCVCLCVRVCVCVCVCVCTW